MKSGDPATVYEIHEEDLAAPFRRDFDQTNSPRSSEFDASGLGEDTKGYSL